MGIMKYTLNVSLEDANVLCGHPAAAGARFRLLHLALLVARYQQVHSPLRACSYVRFVSVCAGACALNRLQSFRIDVRTRFH